MDSSIGRFTSKDPVLYLNLYRYVKNNPMRYADRFGKSDGDETEKKCDALESAIKLYKKRIKEAKKAGKSKKEIGELEDKLEQKVKEYNNECKETTGLYYVSGNVLQDWFNLGLLGVTTIAGAKLGGLPGAIFGFVVGGAAIILHIDDKVIDPDLYYLIPYIHYDYENPRVINPGSYYYPVFFNSVNY